MTTTILFFGDVVGALGRQALANVLPSLKQRFSPDLTIANAENLAHGAGVTAQTLEELSKAGVDAFTGGNHSWNNPVGAALFSDPTWQNRICVPTNYGAAKGGSPSITIEKNGARILILNIMGQLFTHPDTISPFTTLDRLLSSFSNSRELEKGRGSVIIVDLHAEATAEKEALGHNSDGRVSAVFGTHTHVPSADAKILPGGTAYVTDLGRCGAYDSVVGFDKKVAIQRFLSGDAGNYELAKKGRAEVNGIALTIDLDTGRATGLDRIREFVDV